MNVSPPTTVDIPVDVSHLHPGNLKAPPNGLGVLASRTSKGAFATMGFIRALQTSINGGPTEDDGGYRVSIRHIIESLISSSCFYVVKFSSNCYIGRRGTRGKVLLGTLVINPHSRRYNWTSQEVYNATVVLYFGANPSFIRFERNRQTAILNEGGGTHGIVVTEGEEEADAVEGPVGQPQNLTSGETEFLATEADPTVNGSDGESETESEAWEIITV
ncbi:hypothetical protein FRC12_003159 [Ceratobasidium sp. 428]|nr:hypothetical protein FRC12_003159 [Ceratobasidium sp. 428]